MGKKKSNAGRPTVITENALLKLEQAFANGATDLQACFYAGISKSALYEYQQKNPEFTERKAGLKGNIGLIAKNHIATAIRNGDKYDCWKWLEAHEAETFGRNKQSDITKGQGGGSIVNIIIKRDTE